MPYKNSTLSESPPGVYAATIMDPPAGQWTAFFIDVQFAEGDGGFRFTSQISVVPMARPFASCRGANCSRLV